MRVFDPMHENQSEMHQVLSCEVVLLKEKGRVVGAVRQGLEELVLEMGFRKAPELWEGRWHLTPKMSRLLGQQPAHPLLSLHQLGACWRVRAEPLA